MARVAVNHIWLRPPASRWSRPSSTSASMGKPRRIRGLLDWLANAFMDSGWSMKQVHRLIVTSQAYRRQSSAAGSSASESGPGPGEPHALAHEPTPDGGGGGRDNLLHTAGTLEERLGGLDLDPKVGLTSRRRSLYFRHAKEKRVTFLMLFDSANATSCYRRSESVVPQQRWRWRTAPSRSSNRGFWPPRSARDLKSGPNSKDNPTFVTTAFLAAFSAAAPAPDERAACETYLSEQAGRLADKSTLHPFTSGPASTVKPAADPAQRARESLVHILFNHNDFVTIR